MGKSSDSQVVGFRYLFGIHMGVSRGPVDELVEIKVGDKTAWRGNVTTNSTVAIDAPDLFGGEEGEGGVQGTLQVLMGGPTQTLPSLMGRVLKTPMPGFRRRFTLFFDGMISAMNPYPKPWAVRARRARQGWDGDCWYPEKAVVSLVRPASLAEVSQPAGGGADVETQTISESWSGVPTVTGDETTGPWSITLTSEGTVTGIVQAYFLGGYDSEVNSFAQVFLQPTLDYTLSGNVLTLVRQPETESHTPWGYTGRTVFVTFTKTITTVRPYDPEAPGGIGSALIQAMNPIHIIYEAMTNREWGRGFSRTLFDDENWRAAADALFAEQFGMCIRWTRTDSIRSFVQMVIDHIGATVYNDRRTGLFKITLIRANYNPADLRLFDADTGLLGIREASVSVTNKMVNELRVTYRDPVTNEDRTVRAVNMAALQAAGGAINSLTKQYPGLPTADLAARVASRDLKAMSPAVRRFHITLDRRGSRYVPGALLRIQDLARGIPDTVLRIATIDYGQVGSGRVEIVAAQDVFALPAQGFTTIGPPQYTPPQSRPCAGQSAVFEMPYRSLYRELSPADFDYLSDTSAYLGSVCEMGQPLNNSYTTAVKYGTISTDELPPDTSYVCPT